MVYTSSHLNLRVLHLEDSFIVIDKDSGLLAVPGRGEDKQDCVANRIKKFATESIEQTSVHRLDMDTSGIMVLAFTKEAHRNLSIQFQNREVEKVYHAIIEGIPNRESGIIELPFRLDIDNRPYQIYDEVHGKMGITEWQLLDSMDNRSLIKFRPKTGRTHQLRVHSAHAKGLGMPIVGDPLYGNGTGPGQLKLHACELSFKHPESGEMLNFSSPARFKL